VALEIAARALGMSGEVIVPSFTFVATPHALQWQGIQPVFCDIDPHTHNIDAAHAATLITGRTTGIIGVHTWGRPCDVDALTALAHRHELRLLFDAAHAFGCSANAQMVGTLGDAEVLSFHATKFLNAFEGGALVTNDVALAERAGLMRNFGFAGEDHVSYVGTNGKMTEASAAMGLTSLESMNEFIAVNRRNYESYARNLADVPGISLVHHGHGNRSNYHYIVLELAGSIGISRDLLKELLRAENVLARRYFYPGCHRMEPYRMLLSDAGDGLPHTDAVAASVLSLPTGMAMSLLEVERVCELIRFAVARGGEIAARAGRGRASG
jgi:dTDP-4-amino-4,6-dideoxygalactose transaminase